MRAALDINNTLTINYEFVSSKKKEEEEAKKSLWTIISGISLFYTPDLLIFVYLSPSSINSGILHPQTIQNRLNNPYGSFADVASLMETSVANTCFKIHFTLYIVNFCLHKPLNYIIGYCLSHLLLSFFLKFS